MKICVSLVRAVCVLSSLVVASAFVHNYHRHHGPVAYGGAFSSGARSSTAVFGTGNSFGRTFRISTYGESHGGGVGVILDGCPPRIPLNREEVQKELDRR